MLLKYQFNFLGRGNHPRMQVLFWRRLTNNEKEWKGYLQQSRLTTPAAQPTVKPSPATGPPVSNEKAATNKESRTWHEMVTRCDASFPSNKNVRGKRFASSDPEAHFTGGGATCICFREQKNPGTIAPFFVYIARNAGHDNNWQHSLHDAAQYRDIQGIGGTVRVGCDNMRDSWTHGGCWARHRVGGKALGWDGVSFAVAHMVDATQYVGFGMGWGGSDYIRCS